MADYIYLDQTGVIIPDVSAIQSQVQSEYTQLFGENLILNPSTPQGILIAIEMLARISVARNDANLANQINPNESGGVFLDAIWALTGGTRAPAKFTTIPGVILSGVAGTLVSAFNSQARMSDSDVIFELQEDVLIGPGGTGTGLFQATVEGSVQVDIGELDTIVSGPIGWETVNNPGVGIPGQQQQSDISVRSQRRNSLALQGSGLAEAVVSQLVITPGVTGKPSFRENVTGEDKVIDGVNMVPHSMYTCVDGGTDGAVATAIAGKKGGGCNYNNGAGIPVSYPYQNPVSGQIIDVLFDRPNLILILAQVTIKVINASGDPVIAVKQAILNYANGLLNGEDGLTIGTNVSAFQLAGAIASQVPSIFVQLLQIAKVTPPYSSDPIEIEIWEKAYLTNDSISVITL